MSFYDEVEKLLNIDEVKSQIQICIIGMNSVVVSGYSNIISFSDSEVVFRLVNKNIISFKGAKMEIKMLSKGEVVICGEILSLERIGG